MDQKLIKKILKEQIDLLNAATNICKESYSRTQNILNSNKKDLNSQEKESLEALTARFSRLSDFLVQKIFRTIDRIELVDEGSIIDRLNRMEKRSIIKSSKQWVEIRELRNEISHEYLIESSDHVLINALNFCPILFEVSNKVQEYIQQKNFLS